VVAIAIAIAIVKINTRTTECAKDRSSTKGACQ